MKVPTTLAAALAAAALSAPAAGAAGWSCDASAVRAGVLGAAVVEPVTAGAADACTTVTKSLDGALPSPLGASAVVAGTSAEASRVLATGGVASLRAGLLPDLGLPVPQVEVPAALKALTVPLALPSLPLLPAPPSSVTVDLTEAIADLAGTRALPSVPLLELEGAMAYATGSCAGGAPVLDGRSQVAGLRVLGTELPADQAVTRTLTLLDGGLLDLAQLDLGLVDLPAALDTAALRPLVHAAIKGVLTTLEDLPVPAALAQVRVTPAQTAREGDRLTQTALGVALEVLGRPVLDLAVGRASVAARDVACGASVAPAALECTKRKVTLTDVVARGGRVELVGAADRSLAGRTVDLVFEAIGRRVATAVVQPGGAFRATAPLPAAALRGTNLARYRAVIGRERSMGLKLERRMVVSSVRRAGDRVTIAGRVVGPLTAPVSPVLVQRRVTCSRWAPVGRVVPRRDGRFTVTVPAGSADQAVFRLGTTVVKGKGRFPTFTLPRAVETA